MIKRRDFISKEFGQSFHFSLTTSITCVKRPLDLTHASATYPLVFGISQGLSPQRAQK